MLNVYSFHIYKSAYYRLLKYCLSKCLSIQKIIGTCIDFLDNTDRLIN